MSKRRKICIWGITYLSLFTIISLAIHSILGRFDFLSFLYVFLPEVKSFNQSWSLIAVVLVYIWLFCFLLHFRKEKEALISGIVLWLSGLAGGVILSLYPLTLEVAHDAGVMLGESIAISALITFVLFILLLPFYVLSLREKEIEQDKAEVREQGESPKQTAYSAILEAVENTPVYAPDQEEQLTDGFYLISKEGERKYKLSEQRSSFGWIEYVVSDSIESGEYSIVRVIGNNKEDVMSGGFNHGYTLEGIADKVINIENSLYVWNEQEKRSFNYINSKSVLAVNNEEKENLEVFIRFYGDNGEQNGYRWCVIYVK